MVELKKYPHLIFFVLLLGALAALPWLGSSYVLTWVFFLAVSITLALSYDILGGYLGYINLGHATFFGLGAYITAVLLNRQFGFALSLSLAVFFTALFAAIISWPLFRLRGAYFALATFGMIRLIETLAINLRKLTGGTGGLSTAPGDHLLSSYYLSLAAAMGTLFLCYRLTRSALGLALFTIRDDEEAARSIGISASSCKCLAFVISSVPASLVGAIYIWNMTYISPVSVFGLEIALSPVVMAMLGGTGTLAGPLVGAVFLSLVQELLWTKLPYFHLSMYGIGFILLGLFMPGGLVRSRIWNRTARHFLSESKI